MVTDAGFVLGKRDENSRLSRDPVTDMNLRGLPHRDPRAVGRGLREKQWRNQTKPDGPKTATERFRKNLVLGISRSTAGSILTENAKRRLHAPRAGWRNSSGIDFGDYYAQSPLRNQMNNIDFIVVLSRNREWLANSGRPRPKKSANQGMDFIKRPKAEVASPMSIAHKKRMFFCHGRSNRAISCDTATAGGLIHWWA